MSEQALWALTNIVANEEFGGYGISHSATYHFVLCGVWSLWIDDSFSGRE